MSRSNLNVMMILGSIRHGRMVERVAKLVGKTVKESTSMSLSTLDPLFMDPKCELNRQPLHFLPSPDKAPEWLKQTNEAVIKANGFLILTPEYNGNVSPVLLNLMNSLPPPSFRHKPVGIITYTMSTFGAVRSLVAARSYLCEFGLLCVPGQGPIPQVHELVDEAGNCSNELVKSNLQKVVKNVEWYSGAISDYKDKGNAFID